MLADELDYVVGVDTHLDEHVLAVVAAPAGGVVARKAVRANGRGYRETLRFGERYAAGRRAWAIEGSGSYGAGLARYLAEQGETVLELSRAPRAERRLHGKDDALDAARTARAALASDTLALPRAGQRREALRLLLVARRSAVDVRRQALVQLRSVIVTAPDRLRDELRGLPPGSCSSAVAACAARAPQTQTSWRRGWSCAAWPAGSSQRPRRPLSWSARSSPTSVRSRHNCSRSRESARSSPPSCWLPGHTGAGSAPRPPLPAWPGSPRFRPPAVRPPGTDSAAAATANSTAHCTPSSSTAASTTRPPGTTSPDGSPRARAAVRPPGCSSATWPAPLPALQEQEPLVA